MAFGSKKKKTGGFLQRIGVHVEKEASSQDIEEQDRQEKLKTVWVYLRRQVDRGVQEYFTKGDTGTLKEFVASPALDSLVAELEKLRSSGIHWSQPDRATKTTPRLTVVKERLNEHKQPVLFVIQERFLDHSIYKTLDGRSERACEGKERVLQATIEVAGGTSYKILSIIEVRGATL